MNAKFDFIRCANCWEDADVLLEALDVREGGIYLSIASAGDNTLSILSANPSLVIAVDLNPSQLACLELRKAAFSRLEYEGVLEFLGVNPSASRIAVYKSLRELLGKDSQDFWNNNLKAVDLGIIHAGKFENYFRLFRKYVLPLVHGRDTVARLLKPKSRQERELFYQDQWDTWRWRQIFKLFFSRGNSESGIAARILERARYALTVLAAHQNPYLEYVLTGNFQQALPHYLRQENFETIRKNLDKLLLWRGDLKTALDSNISYSFDGFNLSDIFGYMDKKQYAENMRILIERSRPTGRIVYWNMLVSRSCPNDLTEQMIKREEEANRLFAQDKGLFYQALRIEEVK